MGRETEAIEDNIKRIQDRMSERVDHLSDDLSLSSIASRTLGANGEKPGELVDAAINSVREHPIPAALIGAGLVGLLVSQKARPVRSRPNGPAVSDASADPADRVASHLTDLSSEADRLKATAGQKLDNVQNAARDAAGNARNYASEKADDIKQAYSSARTGIDAGTERLKEQTREIGDTVASQAEALKRRAGDVPQQVRRSTTHAADWARDNPVPVGLAALALGAAAASFFTARKATGSSDDDASGHQQPMRRRSDTASAASDPAYVPPAPAKNAEKPKSAAAGKKKPAARRKTAATRKKPGTAKTTATGTSTAAKSRSGGSAKSAGSTPKPAATSQSTTTQSSDAGSTSDAKS